MEVLVTYHPAAALRPGGASYERIIAGDLRRYVGTRGGGLRPPAAAVPAGPVVAVDTEWDASYRLTEIAVAGIRDGAVVVTAERDAAVGALRAAERVVVHAAPGDLDQLLRLGVCRAEWLAGGGVVDTLLGARIVDETLPSYRLEDVLASWWVLSGSWKAATRGRDPATWTAEERRERCVWDAWAAWWLYVGLRERRVSRRLLEFTQAVGMCLHRATLAGAVVDRARLAALDERYRDEAETLRTALVFDAARQGIADFCPTNDHQIRRWLYAPAPEGLGLTPPWTTPTALPAVDRVALRTVRETAPPEAAAVLDRLIRFSEVDKLWGTYVAGLGRLTHWLTTERGWVPFQFRILGARTGRRSSVEPNSQNFGPEIRQVIVSRWPDGKIVEADYRRLEPVVLAWLVGDRALLRAYLGEGYVAVAREMLGREVTEGTPEYRAVKAAVLGVHYHIGAAKLAEQLWFHVGVRLAKTWEAHVEAADALRRAYLRRFPAVARYIERQCATRRERGVITTPTGRTRRLGTQRGKHEDNQAVNYPVQSTAADIVGAAMLEVERRILDKAGLDLVAWHRALLEARDVAVSGGGDPAAIWPRVPVLINEVHDSLVYDCPAEWVPWLVDTIREAAAEVPRFREFVPTWDVPLAVKITVSDRWGDKGEA